MNEFGSYGQNDEENYFTIFFSLVPTYFIYFYLNSILRSFVAINVDFNTFHLSFLFAVQFV